MPSAPTSRDLREGIEVVEVVEAERLVLEGWVQLPSPREARMEERDLG